MEIILSLMPFLFIIVFAILTRWIIPSIIIGLMIGAFLRSDNSLLEALDLFSSYITGAITDESNAIILVFLFGFGALSEIFKLGGGISAFARLAEKRLQSERSAYLSVWLITPLTFLDCCFRIISSGIISKAVLERTNGSKDRLAFIINSSSQLIPLIPFATTYIGYILGLLLPMLLQLNVSTSPYTLYLQAIPYNFYSIIMVLFSGMLTFTEIKPLQLFRPAYKPILSEQGEHTQGEAEHQHTFEEKLPPRLFNLVLPLLIMISALFYLVWRSGVSRGGTSLSQALIFADYELAVLNATIITLSLTILLYLMQKVPAKSLQKAFFAGGVEMLPPIIIISLAWAMILVSRDLEFYDIASNLFNSYLPRQLLPVLFFLATGITSYFIGSSWATWALFLPVALSTAVAADVNLPLILGSVMAGGSVGDNISPLGEDPILVASTIDIPVIDHIRYCVPYGMLAFIVSAGGYLIAGYLL